MLKSGNTLESVCQRDVLSVGGFPAVLLLPFTHKLSSGVPGLFRRGCWTLLGHISTLIGPTRLFPSQSFTGMEREALVICGKWLVRRSQMEPLRPFSQFGLLRALSNAAQTEMRCNRAVRAERLTWQTPALSDFRPWNGTLSSCSTRLVGLEKS